MKKAKNIFDKIAKLINIILLIILVFIIIFGTLLLVQNVFNLSEKVSIFDYKTFIITSESMEPELFSGDIIFVKEEQKLEKDDIITYEERGTKYITHRIIGMVEGDNEAVFKTKGDNNEDADKEPVHTYQIVGKVVGKTSFIRNVFAFITNKFVIGFLIIFYISYFIYNRSENKKGL